MHSITPRSVTCSPELEYLWFVLVLQNMFVQPQRLNGCNLAAPPTQHEYYGGRRIILHERCSCDCLTRSSFGFHCCSGLLQSLMMQLAQFILTFESFNSAQRFSNGCHFAKSCLLVTAKGLGVEVGILTAHMKSFVPHVPENYIHTCYWALETATLHCSPFVCLEPEKLVSTDWCDFPAENCSFSLEGTLCRWTFRIGIYPSSMSFIVDNIRYSMPERIGFFLPQLLSPCWPCQEP